MELHPKFEVKAPTSLQPGELVRICHHDSMVVAIVTKTASDRPSIVVLTQHRHFQFLESPVQSQSVDYAISFGTGWILDLPDVVQAQWPKSASVEQPGTISISPDGPVLTLKRQGAYETPAYLDLDSFEVRDHAELQAPLFLQWRIFANSRDEKLGTALAAFPA